MGFDMFKNNLAGKDLLLVVPPPFFTRMPPLGPAYLVTYLKCKGYKPELLDLSVRLYNQASEEMRRFWQPDYINSFFATEIAEKLFDGFRGEMNNFVEWVINSDIPIVAFSVNQASLFLANKLAQAIKSKDRTRTIIFGGPATFFKHPRELIQPGFGSALQHQHLPRLHIGAGRGKAGGV